MEYLLKCSSRHCLQNLWPHFVSIGFFNANWQIAHCKSSSTALTKSSSYPPRDTFAGASAIFNWALTRRIIREWPADHVNEWFSSNRIPCFAHRILGSLGGNHCESLQRNVWRGVVSPVKAVSLDRECNILPWFYEQRRWLMLVRRNCKFLWDQCDEIYR